MAVQGEEMRSGITSTIVLTVVFAVVLGVSLQHVVSSGLVYLGLARQQTFDSQNPRLLRQAGLRRSSMSFRPAPMKQDRRS
jgi:hypothetical protein